MAKSETIIHLSDKRECFQTETFRSFVTLPNKDSAYKFKVIHKLADITLSPKKSFEIKADDNYCFIFLPLVGAVEIKDSLEERILNSGEIAYRSVKIKDKILVQNPYKNELINYLEIWLKNDSNEFNANFFTEFNLEKNKNNLIEISNSGLLERIYVGKYDGRNEGFLNEIESAFVFVINGVFEVNNRLLEARDGLSLCNFENIEFEGLGVENIILIIIKRNPQN